MLDRLWTRLTGWAENHLRWNPWNREFQRQRKRSPTSTNEELALRTTLRLNTSKYSTSASMSSIPDRGQGS